MNERRGKGPHALEQEQLIRRCQAGDRDAFRCVVDDYGGMLFATAYLMTHQREVSEDAVQEALLRAWRGIRSFRNEGSFRAWLMRILVNEVNQMHRRRRIVGEPLQEASAAQTSEGDPDEVVLADEERHRLRRALSALPEEQRAVVVLRYYAELSIREVAQAMGCREGTVKSRLHRALGQLNEALSGTEG